MTNEQPQQQRSKELPQLVDEYISLRKNDPDKAREFANNSGEFLRSLVGVREDLLETFDELRKEGVFRKEPDDQKS